MYERIAEDFESQQYRPWPKIKEFLEGLEPGSLVLDVGKRTKKIVIARVGQIQHTVARMPLHNTQVFS